MGSNSFLNYDWHVRTRNNHQKRHDYYLTTLSEQNRIKREVEKANTDAETERKKQLERGFSAYVNGPHSAKKRVESRAASRAASRAGSALSPEKSKMDEPDVAKAHRKSWVDSDVLRGDALPDFVTKNNETYSANFDDSIDEEIFFQNSTNFSDTDSIPERLSNISVSSSNLHIPKLTPSKRKSWKMETESPFIQPTRQTSNVSSSSMSDSDGTPPGDFLRGLNRNRREKNWLEESWNLIDNFEKNNKGRTSMIFDEEKDSCDIPDVIVEQPNELEDVEMESFESVIPSLPNGKIIEFEIISTWGDRNYVGLNGVEFWNHHGQPISPARINSQELTENPLDPRSSFQNLNDGNYCTNDDMHSWLCEVQADKRPKVQFLFDQSHTFSLIRIWNYNRNRVHANRGVKDINIRLDNKLVFCGEITCASGTVDSALPWGDNILFTTDDQILENIAQTDTLYAQISQESE